MILPWMEKEDSVLKREWRHRFYKLGKVAGAEVLKEFGIEGEFPRHDELRDILFNLIDNRFREFRRSVERAEGKVE